MKTIICDIDGTITNMWPIEKSVLLCMTKEEYKKEIEKIKSSGLSDTYKIFRKISKQKITKTKYFYIYNKIFSELLKNKTLPQPKKYPLIDWILQNKNTYHFVYATGGQKRETLYVLRCLDILGFFDLKNSIDKTTCRFSKKTGIPFNKIKFKFKDCVVIADGKGDEEGAKRANIACIRINYTDRYFSSKIHNTLH